MNSAYSKLYLDLQSAIKNAIPEITFIEQYFGQDKFEDFISRVSFPAALIDFPDSSFSNLSEIDLLAKVKIAVLLMFNTHSQTYHMAPEAVRERGLEYLECEHKIIALLHGWDADYCTNLVLQNIRSRNVNPDGIRMRELIFETELFMIRESDETTSFTFSFTGSIEKP